VSRNVASHLQTSRLRLLAAAILTPLAIIVAVAAVPVQNTLASFTDGEHVRGGAFTAATLATVNSITSCSAPTFSNSISLAWSAPTGGTVPTTGYQVVFTNTDTGVITQTALNSTSTSASVAVSGLANGTYQVMVKARSSSAATWTSITGDTVTLTKRTLNFGGACQL
jgi:predicted ribosomally synthesized peptide with SipW-like signal peptide